MRFGTFLEFACPPGVSTEEAYARAFEHVDQAEAAGLDIGFNARYLLDITAQLEGDTALFKLADPGSPTLIQDREGAPALYVLMPMRV